MGSTYRYHVACGNWQIEGYERSLEDAERTAFKVSSTIKNNGVVHTVYSDGKLIKQPTETFQESLIKDGFISLTNVSAK